jgi:Ax21 family sulfation-dependent quorum factor
MKRFLMIVSLLAPAPFAASAAEGLSYDHVAGGYTAINGDGGADADGFGVNGSVAIHPNFHVFGGYGNQEIDDTSIDFDQWRLGVGYNLELSPKTDLVTRLAYEKFDAGSGFDFDGYSAEVGVRGALLPRLDGYAFAGYEDFEQSSGDFYGRLGANLKFNSNWALNGDVKFADGDTQYFVGPRFSW